MYHIILNPVSGKKKALKNLLIVERLFAERGVAYEVHRSCAVRDAEAIARWLTEQGEREISYLAATERCTRYSTDSSSLPFVRSG